MPFLGLIELLGVRCREQDGQTMAEYAVILGVITPAILVAIAVLAGDIGSALDAVRALLP